VVEFLDYMWEWPLMMTPDFFGDWESKATDLVQAGLGDPFPSDVEPVLAQQGIAPSEFRALVAGTVEIIWGSFYAASDNKGSLRDLANVIATCRQRGVQPPPIDVFEKSRFADKHGWGHVLTIEERNAWRQLGAG